MSLLHTSRVFAAYSLKGKLICELKNNVVCVAFNIKIFIEGPISSHDYYRLQHQEILVSMLTAAANINDKWNERPMRNKIKVTTMPSKKSVRAHHFQSRKAIAIEVLSILTFNLPE